MTWKPPKHYMRKKKRNCVSAFKKAQLIDEINKFVRGLEKNQIHIQQAILFGSYAKGTAKEWSDIDLALVSEDFSGIRFLDWKKNSAFS
jgi:predicted nucleotidyltransferase